MQNACRDDESVSNHRAGRREVSQLLVLLLQQDTRQNTRKDGLVLAHSFRRHSSSWQRRYAKRNKS